MRPEDSRIHFFDRSPSQRRDELIEKVRGRGRLECLKKFGSTPFGCFRKEGKLRDGQHLAVDLYDILVECLCPMLEDSHLYDLVDHRLDTRRGVAFAESNEKH
ncbi:MAG: hypothetical protein RIS36_849 [Pseudomonadota bacterium]